MEGQVVDPPVVFGRQPTLEYLEQRVQHNGLTAVVGGPMTGKSAVLSELDRRLSADGEYLVGLYEAKAGEVSHFLYAIANLYERWLADATMREQATVLWRRHSNELIPRVGQAFGRVLKAFAGTDTAGVAELISSTFDGLKGLQDELKSAGLSLAPLPYDQTRDLANLVADLTRKRVVLILDDWGNSANPVHERQTLEAFLKHTEEWHRTHIIFAVRRTIGAQREAEDLTFLRRSELAQAHELPPLDLSSELERRKLLLYLRERVPASAEASEDELMELIGGMPGVLTRWVEGAMLGSVTGLDTLRQRAEEAHAFRYTDLARALDRLPKEALLLCARVAFLPRFNRLSWDYSRAAVLEGLDRAVLDDLVGTVLERHPEDIRIPSFGHQTRHAAARRHIARQQPHLMARVADALIERLAVEVSGEISGLGEKDLFAVVVLASREKALAAVDCSETSQFLVAAAASVMSRPAALADRPVDHGALKASVQRVPGLTSLVAMGLVNRGVELRRKRDHIGAVADYTAVIEMPAVPNYPLMNALFNRANCREELSDRAGGRADLNESQKLLDASNPKDSSVLDYGLLHFKLGQYREASCNYTKIVASPSASPAERGRAFHGRGAAKYQLQDISGAIADFTAALAVEETPVEYKAAALSARGEAKYAIGDVLGSLTDFSARIEFPVGPVAGTGLALAYLSRGLSRQARGESAGAITDFGHAISAADGSARERAQASLARGLLLQQCQNFIGAREDFNRVIALGSAAGAFLARGYMARAILLLRLDDSGGARADFLAGADATEDGNLQRSARQMAEHLDQPPHSAPLLNCPDDELAFRINTLAVRKGQHGDIDGEIADYTAVIELPDASANQVALALYNRGVRRHERGDTDGAIADYTAAIELPNAPPYLVACALSSRGSAKSEKGDRAGAIGDCTALIDRPNAPDDLVASAVYSRGVMKSNCGDVEGAISDYTAVIARPNTSVDLVAKALYNRGVVKGRRGDLAAAIADYTAAIELPKVPVAQAAYALHNRGVLKSCCNDKEGAIADYAAAIDLPNAPRELVERARVRLTEIVASSEGSSQGETSVKQP